MRPEIPGCREPPLASRGSAEIKRPHRFRRWIRPVLRRRSKWFHKRFLKIKHVRKVLAAIGLRLAKYLVFNKIKYNLSKIGGPVDAPGVEHRLRERPKLIKGECAQSLKQLPARNMWRFLGPLGIRFTEILHRIIETLPHEEVCLFVEAGIVLANQVYDLGEIEVLHHIVSYY